MTEDQFHKMVEPMVSKVIDYMHECSCYHFSFYAPAPKDSEHGGKAIRLDMKLDVTSTDEMEGAHKLHDNDLRDFIKEKINEA